MDTAPRDGTMVRLLVDFEDHATEDAEGLHPTIGANYLGHSGEDRWQFAGWCWTHDHFTEGKGTPVGWLPMLAEGPQQPAAEAQPDRMAIKLLVAAGFVTEAKANEALNIAHGFATRPLEPAEAQPVATLDRNDFSGLPVDNLEGIPDNLAIALCSYYEGHRDRPEDDPETENGWGRWVEDQANAMLDRIAAMANEARTPPPSAIVVDEAMVDRAWRAYYADDGTAREGIHAALTAALTAQQGGS